MAIREQGAGAARLITPLRVDGVFDDPGFIRRMAERHGPYRTMASFLPVSAVRGHRAAADARQPRGGCRQGQQGVPPHFRATWASGGRPLVDGAEVILHNPTLLRAASQLFGAEMVPNTVAVNIGAPQAAGGIHVDVPSFRGADRDRYPMQLLQAMAASGLFEDWQVTEAGAVIWSYHGRGGAYDYWPDGLDGPMRSEQPPFTNSALVADNNRMYHRIGWIGDPAAAAGGPGQSSAAAGGPGQSSTAPPALSVAAQISHVARDGWIVTDAGRAPVRYEDRDIRISVLWKARVQPGRESGAVPLTPELITQIISADLTRRGVLPPGRVSSLSDQSWLDLVHSTYYEPPAPPG